MRLTVHLIVVLLALAACQTRRATPPSDRPAAASAPADAPARRVEIVEAPADVDVATWVRSAMAARPGRSVLVYEGATWCEPCTRFHEAAQAGKLDAKLPTLTLLQFDSDRDSERLANAGYYSQFIPMFAVPDKEGRASGVQLEGGVKGDGAVEELVAKIQPLVAQAAPR